MSFLVNLPSKYETTKSQILLSNEISSLQDTLSKMLRTKNSLPAHPPALLNNLVSWNNNDSGKKQYINNSTYILVNLPSKYETTKSQILLSNEISSLQDTLSKMLRTKNSPPVHPPALLNNLVSWNNNDSGKKQYINSSSGGNIRGPSSGGVMLLLS